jgi:inner membrane protein
MENEQNGIIDKTRHWAKTSIMLKMITIGFLILILLIPENMIKSLIRERSYARDGAVKEVSNKWGSEQTITGPILTIPYITDNYKNGQHIKTRQYAHFLPSKVLINGSVNPHEKHRGIYDIIIYDSDLEIDGEFENLPIENLNLDDSDLLWEEAKIAIGISDLRGLTDVIKINWNNTSISMHPGIENAQMINSGVHAPITIPKHTTYNDDGSISQITHPMNDIKFSYNLKVNGSSHLRFTPIGKQTTVNLKSSWDSPKFDGAFLPQTHDINDSGFVSQWKIISLNRNYPQQWVNSNYRLENSDFGVDLILPIDEYQKTLRSAKYASLIVLLTFLAFFFIEIANAIRIHPLQYVLIGSALILFYTLLLSISEHFGFNVAYIVSTILIAGLIGMYSKFIFTSATMSALLTLGLGGIYSFMFFVLNSEDYALLMGSIGLFVILSIVMYATRNINFYKSA